MALCSQKQGLQARVERKQATLPTCIFLSDLLSALLGLGVFLGFGTPGMGDACCLRILHKNFFEGGGVWDRDLRLVSQQNG